MNGEFLRIFDVSVSQLETLVGTALSGGGDYADLYFENTVYNDITLRDGIVSSGGCHIDYGVGIRVLDGDRTGYAYSESTSMPDMLLAAKSAAAIAESSHNKNVIARFASRNILADNRFYSNEEIWRNEPKSRFVPVLEAIEKMVNAREKRTEKVVARLSYSTSDIMMFNSLGELTADRRPMCNLNISVVFAQDGRIEQKNAGRSFRRGPEMLLSPDGTPSPLVKEIVDEVCSGLDEQFAAIRPKGGSMPVVMGAGASGILLHEAMGHAFEADFNRKGQSIFAGKIGERVCAKCINIVDDGTITYNRGACTFDDEGVPGQKTYMVRDGILESYLHDRISAKYFNVAPTGNGRRESFRCIPLPRMRATYMESGNCSAEEIISSVRKGIYVDEFSNGQVKIGEGDFTFFVKSGRLIENGRLTAPIKDINIIGNGPKALSKLTMVGSDLKIDNGTWTCGKDQNVAVSCGIPTVLVGGLTVGGE